MCTLNTMNLHPLNISINPRVHQRRESVDGRNRICAGKWDTSLSYKTANEREIVPKCEMSHPLQTICICFLDLPSCTLRLAVSEHLPSDISLLNCLFPTTQTLPRLSSFRSLGHGPVSVGCQA